MSAYMAASRYLTAAELNAGAVPVTWLTVGSRLLWIAAAMVLLVPQDLNRSLIIRRDQSDSDGTFTLREIPPGRYTLLAIDDGSGLAYADPAAIQPYLAGGQVIDIPMADAGPVKVQVVARKR